MRNAVSAALTIFLLVTAASSGADCGGKVYLTLDTGNMSQAETIAQILREAHVRATFFVANEKTFRGDYALDPSWAPYWRSRVAEGHRFGNHTWSHASLRRDVGEKILARDMQGREHAIDQAAFCADLKRVDARFYELTQRHLDGVWRAPGGRTTAQAIRWAASCGFPAHLAWTDAGFFGDELPSERFPNAQLLRRAQERIGDGDVILLHLGIWSRHEPLAPMLKPLIATLQKRGLCFATWNAT